MAFTSSSVVFTYPNIALREYPQRELSDDALKFEVINDVPGLQELVIYEVIQTTLFIHQHWFAQTKLLTDIPLTQRRDRDDSRLMRCIPCR